MAYTKPETKYAQFGREYYVEPIDSAGIAFGDTIAGNVAVPLIDIQDGDSYYLEDNLPYLLLDDGRIYDWSYKPIDIVAKDDNGDACIVFAVSGLYGDEDMF